MSLTETISTGINNPECAFFVGQSLGYASAGTLMFRIALVYFGFKLLEKIAFVGIPLAYKKIKQKKK